MSGRQFKCLIFFHNSKPPWSMNPISILLLHWNLFKNSRWVSTPMPHLTPKSPFVVPVHSSTVWQVLLPEKLQWLHFLWLRSHHTRCTEVLCRTQGAHLDLHLWQILLIFQLFSKMPWNCQKRKTNQIIKLLSMINIKSHHKCIEKN